MQLHHSANDQLDPTLLYFICLFFLHSLVIPSQVCKVQRYMACQNKWKFLTKKYGYSIERIGSIHNPVQKNVIFCMDREIHINSMCHLFQVLLKTHKSIDLNCKWRFMLPLTQCLTDYSHEQFVWILESGEILSKILVYTTEI